MLPAIADITRIRSQPSANGLLSATIGIIIKRQIKEPTQFQTVEYRTCESRLP